MRTIARAVVVAALAGLGWPPAAAAQLPEGPYVAAGGRVTVAGELAATASPRDNNTFFNYTDYEHDALRTVRARVLGEWRIASRLTALGELRVENRDSVEAAALFLRWRPLAQHEFDIQAGRIPPVVGAFARRAYGRDNLVIGLPLAYQYLTSLRSDALPATADDVLSMRARGWRSRFPIGSPELGPGIALINAFRWATGAEARWRTGRVDLAGAVTRGAPAVPEVMDTQTGVAWSGRVAVEPVVGLTVGVSGARGPWIHQSALATFARPAREHDAQTLVGTDVEFGLGRLLLRGEWIRTSFDLPTLAPLTASSGFAEGRYRWHPRWQTAVRIERLGFSAIRGTALPAASPGARTPWDAPVKRVEAVLGFRATRNLELRMGWQHNWRRASRVSTKGVPAVQVLYWF